MAGDLERDMKLERTRKEKYISQILFFACFEILFVQVLSNESGKAQFQVVLDAKNSEKEKIVIPVKQVGPAQAVGGPNAKPEITKGKDITREKKMLLEASQISSSSIHEKSKLDAGGKHPGPGGIPAVVLQGGRIQGGGAPDSQSKNEPPPFPGRAGMQHMEDIRRAEHISEESGDLGPGMKSVPVLSSPSKGSPRDKIRPHLPKMGPDWASREDKMELEKKLAESRSRSSSFTKGSSGPGHIPSSYPHKEELKDQAMKKSKKDSIPHIEQTKEESKDQKDGKSKGDKKNKKDDKDKEDKGVIKEDKDDKEDDSREAHEESKDSSEDSTEDSTESSKDSSDSTKDSTDSTEETSDSTGETSDSTEDSTDSSKDSTDSSKDSTDSSKDSTGDSAEDGEGNEGGEANEGESKDSSGATEDSSEGPSDSTEGSTVAGGKAPKKDPVFANAKKLKNIAKNKKYLLGIKCAEKKKFMIKVYQRAIKSVREADPLKLGDSLDSMNIIDGTFTGLHTLKNMTDVKVRCRKHGVIVISTKVKIKDADIVYSWRATILKTNIKGRLSMSADTVEIGLVARIDITKKVPVFHVKSGLLTELEHFNFAASGLGEFDRVLNVIGNKMYHALKQPISLMIGEMIRKELEKEFNDSLGSLGQKGQVLIKRNPKKKKSKAKKKKKKGNGDKKKKKKDKDTGRESEKMNDEAFFLARMKRMAL